MRRLLLVRHAFARSNRDGLASCAAPGDGLTPEGVAQARLLGERLVGEAVSLGVATRHRRTQETLEIALEGRAVPMIVVSELDEIDFGTFGDGPLADYREWASSHSPSELPPGGGESRAAAAARFARGLRALLARREDVVLAVTHALVARYVLDASRGSAPTARIEPIEHGAPHTVEVDELEAAARFLESWSRSPSFRDPPNEG